MNRQKKEKEGMISFYRKLKPLTIIGVQLSGKIKTVETQGSYSCFLTNIATLFSNCIVPFLTRMNVMLLLINWRAEYAAMTETLKSSAVLTIKVS
jgi:hypothetical protein